MTNKVTGDVIGREISVGDFVFHYNFIYKVLAVGNFAVTMMIHPPSKTSKKKTIMSRECCLLPPEEVTMWILKNGKI